MGFFLALLQTLALGPLTTVSLLGTALVGVTGLFRKRLPPPRCVLITGATQGLGEALALSYAAPGVTLALTGRNAVRLEAVAAACRARGAVTRLGALDVTDMGGMEKFVAETDAAAPIDLVVANAGVSEETAGVARGDLAAATRKLFAVNVDGVFNTVLPIIPRMKERRRGQIALMASLAGTCGIPSAATYSATKVAVRAYGEAIRGLLYRDGVLVNVICPGFVRSPMTDANEGWMARPPAAAAAAGGVSGRPFFWETEPAVRHIVAALARDEPVVQFPAPLTTLLWGFGQVLPTSVKHLLGRWRALPGLAYLGRRRGGGSGGASKKK